jgi:hypothetical protein
MYLTTGNVAISVLGSLSIFGFWLILYSMYEPVTEATKCIFAAGSELFPFQRVFFFFFLFYSVNWEEDPKAWGLVLYYLGCHLYVIVVCFWLSQITHYDQAEVLENIVLSGSLPLHAYPCKVETLAALIFYVQFTENSHNYDWQS